MIFLFHEVNIMEYKLHLGPGQVSIVDPGLAEIAR